MSALTINREQTAGTLTGSSDRLVYAVVGFDGSASSLRALDAAAQLLNDRPGGMEIVYVAHIPAVAAPGPVGAASADMFRSFDDTTRELSEEVQARLKASHLRAAAQRWHFQRRDGAIADNLIAVADDLRLPGYVAVQRVPRPPQQAPRSLVQAQSLDRGTVGNGAGPGDRHDVVVGH
jgi:hypothetical protein